MSQCCPNSRNKNAHGKFVAAELYEVPYWRKIASKVHKRVSAPLFSTVGRCWADAPGSFVLSHCKSMLTLQIW